MTEEPLELGSKGLPPAPRSGAAEAPCLQVTTAYPQSETPPETGESVRDQILKLSGSQKRAAWQLAENATSCVVRWSADNTLFITLTFGGGKLGPTVEFAQRCFHSLLTNVLAALFPGGIKVLERGEKKGRVHFHCLVDAGFDVRTGVDLVAMGKGDRSTFGPKLVELIAHIKAKLKGHGFGVVFECDPIKSTEEAVSRYVSKYISKHVSQRRESDKGARFSSYWGTAKTSRRVHSCQFSWAGKGGEGGWLFRQKLAAISKLNGIKSSDDWARKFGPRWCYHISRFIEQMPLGEYVNGKAAIMDGMSIFQELSDDHTGSLDLENGRVSFSQVDPETGCKMELGRVRDVELFGKRLLFMVAWHREYPAVVETEQPLPKYDPPPRVVGSVGPVCEWLDETLIVGDTVTRRKVKVPVGAGVKFTPESAEREDLAV